jgi:hypothetical protein
VTECTRWVAARDAVAEQETNTKGGPLRDPGHQERVDFVRQYAVRLGFSWLSVTLTGIVSFEYQNAYQLIWPSR